MEYGLLGIVADPKFSENGLRLHAVLPDDSTRISPPGLDESRRISKMSRPRISRFTINRTNKTLELSSERILFEYDAQIFSCCHVGGGMGFDQEGNLYVTTGDTNSSQNSDGGYSGNNPVNKCPVGPADVPTSAHCGTANYSYQDARRTAGNTNDYNGKMLRFNPIENIPPGTPARRRHDVHLPTADVAQRPEPLQGHRGRRQQGQARDLRDGSAQPEPSLDRPEDRHAVHGVGRPGRQRPERDLGPVDVRERRADHARRQLRLAVLHGLQAGLPRPRWPTAPRAPTARPATCSGGPATGGTDGWYDCDNLRNDSPNNTGLVEFPHGDRYRRQRRQGPRQQPLVQPRQPGQRTTAARSSRVRAAPPPPRTTPPTRRRAARTPATTA